ncbi:MAG: signal peptide peptidase SppA, partial [Deltaproteobacteria bacterium]
GIPEETLARLRERVSISPPEAAEAGLIDGVFHPDEVEREVAERFGHPVSDPPETPERSRQWQEPAIAVIHVSGDIVPVSTSLFAESADGEKIAEAIEQAREDPGIRAIVLRVDSPGGAVLPSERIAREVERTRGEKPIVVSMGNVAASGGYMVSAPGERIFANPSTLTGSIGIFGLKFNLADLLARLDIHTETLRTGEHADVGSLFRPWTSEEISGIMREMRYHYERFVALVARGRGRSPEEIDRVGRGRIWSGAMAREVGLVDEIGGFLAALDAARSRAGLSPGTSVRLVQLPVRQRGMFDLVQRFTGSRLATPSLPPRIAQPLRTIPASLWSEGSVLARLPWILLTR